MARIKNENLVGTRSRTGTNSEQCRPLNSVYVKRLRQLQAQQFELTINMILILIGVAGSKLYERPALWQIA